MGGRFDHGGSKSVIAYYKATLLNYWINNLNKQNQFLLHVISYELLQIRKLNFKNIFET